jgi:tetratricopeptide (TPR) repeat protein
MEKTNRVTDNWFYLNTLVQTAKAYTEIGQLEKAKPIYEKALQKEPALNWVKKELYPELLKNIAN